MLCVVRHRNFWSLHDCYQLLTKWWALQLVKNGASRNFTVSFTPDPLIKIFSHPLIYKTSTHRDSNRTSTSRSRPIQIAIFNYLLTLKKISQLPQNPDVCNERLKCIDIIAYARVCKRLKFQIVFDLESRSTCVRLTDFTQQSFNSLRVSTSSLRGHLVLCWLKHWYTFVYRICS